MSPLLGALLVPGARLMQRLRLPWKLGLIGLMLFVPMLALLGVGLASVRSQIDYTRGEIEGARVVAALLPLALQLQQQRGLTNRQLSGDAGAAAPLAEARRRVLDELARTDALVTRGLSRLDLADTWPGVHGAIKALAEGRHDSDRARAFAAHSAQVDALQGLMVTTAERSGLLLDPEGQSYFLMSLAVEYTLPWAEELGQLRGRGAGLLTRGEGTLAERAQVMSGVEQLQRLLADSERRVAALVRTGFPRPAAFDAALQRTRAYAEASAATFGADTIRGDAKAHFEAGNVAIAGVAAFGQSVNASLEQALVQRVARLQTLFWLELAGSLVGTLLVAYFCSAFYRSFVSATRRLAAGVAKVADGDLSHRFEIHGRDEMAQIGSHVERMADKLSAMVAEIRNSAVRVASTGEQLSSSSAALAQRTEEQAGSLRQFVATVGQMSNAVATSARDAQALDGTSQELRRQADEGGRAMGETIQSLDQLQASARRVGEIVGTIDALAFQTNILALNAAVESARAGEAGRGFAVVASEVRRLAQRSSEAAGEIRRLIAESTERTDAAVARTQQTGRTLAAVVQGVGTVSERLRLIAGASAEQSRGLEEMAAAVGNLDEITRQNAAMVEESTSASRSLVGRAEALGRAVASIRLRQGGADEARALVARAQELVRRTGRHHAEVELHSAEAGFVDRDLYVFFIDRAGVYRLHGAKPEWEGRRVHEVPGIDGERFVREAWAAAAAGGAWVEYDIVNGVTGQVQPKASWIEPLDGECVIGCGVYRLVDSVAAAAPAASAPPSVARPVATGTMAALPSLAAAPARTPARTTPQRETVAG